MNIAVKAQAAPTPTPALEDFRDALFMPMGVDGVYARTALYQRVFDALDKFVTRHRDHSTEVMRFPPLLSRKVLETSGYLKSFPNLLGCVCCLHGSEAEIGGAVARWEDGGDWTTSTTSADFVLTPAACYALYPIVAQRGAVPPQGLVFDVAADCFRHEPSNYLDRLQSFRMREYVCIGTPERVAEFRTRWMDKARHFAARLGLPHEIETANDPFFGRTAPLLAISQRQNALKFELLVPVVSAQKPTACMSFNYHKDHFGLTWDMRGEDGAPVHTGCVAFGMDRLTVALFATHGPDIAAWPTSVRKALAL
jgi:seryl-tRNA synthetase